MTAAYQQYPPAGNLALGDFTSSWRAIIDDGAGDEGAVTIAVLGEKISGLSAAEWTQLQNIDSSTISTTQWGYLGALDQGLASTATAVSWGGASSGAVVTAGNNSGISNLAWALSAANNSGGVSPPSNFGLCVGWNYSGGSGETNIVYGVALGGNPGLEISAWTGSVYTRVSFFDASGRVHIGTGTPDVSAKLDVSSTTQGFLPPRMTTTQRDAITTPAAGLMVFNTTTAKLNFYNGSAWEAVTSA